MEQSAQSPTQLRLVAPTELGETPSAYSNFVQVTATPHDFTLHFGWYAVPPFSEPPQASSVDVEVRPVIKVSVPLNLMRAMVSLLETQAQGWEVNMGEALPENPVAQASETSEERATR